MMMMSLRLQDQIVRKLRDRQMSCEILAFATGIHSSQISRWLRGTLELRNGDALLLDSALNDFEAIENLAFPFALTNT